MTQRSDGEVASPMRIKRALAFSDVGLKMKVNEDAVLQAADVPLYAVADGTGGPEPADIALDVLRRRTPLLRERMAHVVRDRASSSRLAIGRFFEEAFAEASAEIQARAERLGKGRMASTLIAATVVDQYAFVAHVGNSRAYLMRNHQLWRLTTDHTVAMAQYRRGDISAEEYKASPFKKTLTQALGTTPELDVEFAEVWLAPGDVLLLCSDGLTRVVTEERIANALAAGDLARASRELMQATQDAGAPDNVSLVLLDVESAGGDAGRVASTVASLMREVFLFQDLSEPDRMVIAPYLEELFFEPGHTICAEGEPGDVFYVVLSGRVRVTRGHTHLTDIGPGGHFGELALARPSARSATVTALEKTRAFGLSRARFQQIARGKPEIGARLLMPLLDHVGDRLADLTERLSNIERAVHSTPPRAKAPA